MTFLRSYNYNLMGDYNIDKEKYYRVSKGNKVVYIPEEHMKNIDGAIVGGRSKSKSKSSRKTRKSRGGRRSRSSRSN